MIVMSPVGTTRNISTDNCEVKIINYPKAAVLYNIKPEPIFAIDIQKYSLKYACSILINITNYLMTSKRKPPLCNFSFSIVVSHPVKNSFQGFLYPFLSLILCNSTCLFEQSERDHSTHWQQLLWCCLQSETDQRNVA